jgi:hypothetical protein
MDEKTLPFADYTSPDWSDVLIDALHIAIADKLEKNPRLIGIVVHNLSIWRRRHPEQQRLVRQWKVIVYTWEFADILRFLREPSADARQMRRMSPFCGILTAEEIAGTCVAVSESRRSA